MAIPIDEIRLALQWDLLCEIYPEIRMIVFKYDPKKKFFLLRYYLDREPTLKDFDNAGNVLAELISHYKFSEFDEVKSECIYSDALMKDLDRLDGPVYARKEWFD